MQYHNIWISTAAGSNWFSRAVASSNAQYEIIMLFVAAFFLGLIFNAAPGACRRKPFARACAGVVSPGTGGAARSLVGTPCGPYFWSGGHRAVVATLRLASLAHWRGGRLLLALAGSRFVAGGGEELTLSQARRWDLAAVGRACRRAAVGDQSANVAYWAALGSAMGAVGVHEPTAADLASFAGFMVSSVVWAFVCAAMSIGFTRPAASGRS